MIPEALLEVPEIAEAVEALRESSYTRAELEQYDKYWDVIRTQQPLVNDALKTGKLEGKIEGKIEGNIEVAKALQADGFSLADIQRITGLSLEELQSLAVHKSDF
jgi:predicted transposase/invertase (TIGR01784 family)